MLVRYTRWNPPSTSVSGVGGAFVESFPVFGIGRNRGKQGQKAPVGQNGDRKKPARWRVGGWVGLEGNRGPLGGSLGEIEKLDRLCPISLLDGSYRLLHG